MTTAASRVLTIGLELGDGQLIHQWARAGGLPVIAGLMERGRWSWLETSAERLHISAWPSIYTGATPGEHGVYFTFQPEPGLQGYRRFHPGLYGKPTFWRLLDQQGRRCIVFDPPYSHPEEGFGGHYVYDWGSWAHYLQPGSIPPDLLKRLNRSCGCYPLGLEANDLGFDRLDPADLAPRLVKSVAAKAEATCWLMQQQPAWQMLFTVFGETHVAGHYLWSDQLSGDPERDRNTPMFEVYASLDRAIGRVCEAAGNDITVMIVSGDRVGPNHAGWHLLPEILERLGHAAGPAREEAPQPAAPRRFDPVKALRDLLPKEFRKNLARKLPTRLRDKLAQRVDTADIDWSRTRAYCLPTDLEGYIRVNLKGREPQGVVEPGAEYEALLDDLTVALGELRDPQTGGRLVAEVVRTDREFPGARRQYLPDLVVKWEAGRPIHTATSARVGTVSGSSPDTRPGTHRGPGFLLAAGPRLPPGQSEGNGHILDLAPTVLAMLGIDKPPHMPGRVLEEFLP